MTDGTGLLASAASEISERYPVIGGNLVPHGLDDEPGALQAAQDTIEYVWRRCLGESERFSGMVDSFAEISYDFLRLQARFNKTGHYARESAEGLVDDLYSDPEEMHSYIEGLLMTYAMWPNHARILDFFKTDVLANAAPGSRFREIGVGHGLMASLIMQSVPNAEYLGIDLSPHTIAYAKAALAADFDAPEADRPWSFVEADATRVASNSEPGDWILCCEVLEHVDQPLDLLATCRALVGDDGRGFLTTVANLEASDHVYLYDTADHIRSHIEQAGFHIESDLALALPGSEDADPLPLNYAAVVSIAK